METTLVSAIDAYDIFKMNCPSRRVFDLIGERWTCLVMLALHGQPQRFSALRRQIEGISQKMLTQTLRTLEREGVVRRKAFATVPVTVEYSLTPLGENFCGMVEGLRVWAYQHADTMAAARQSYDTRDAQLRNRQRDTLATLAGGVHRRCGASRSAVIALNWALVAGS
jgi:DNA-binding HxlR family transcriptional regulator